MAHGFLHTTTETHLQKLPSPPPGGISEMISYTLNTFVPKLVLLRVLSRLSQFSDLIDRTNNDSPFKVFKATKPPSVSISLLQQREVRFYLAQKNHS